ncbi:MAG TPA: phage tail protein [Acidimicrobiales bacterium]|jgi:phage tail-like protein|nr:phage tail protein [Acidimicrobiales bacterium]
MPTSEDAKHGLAMRFEVEIGGHDLGGWAKCEGLDVTFDVCQYQEGRTDNFTWYYPGRTKYSHIKLTRACTKAETGKVMEWLSKTQATPTMGTGKITLKDAWKGEVHTWDLKRVLPVKWTGPSLDAGGTNVALEQLELIHEGFLTDS